MGKLPKPAQYLLRIDDVCPTVHHESWQALASIIREFRIFPILAVVPHNEDPQLRQSLENPQVWEDLRIMQSEGSAIGLHGFNHLCTSRAKSLIPLHSEVEFSGLPLEEQRARIRAGIEILRSQGLTPQLWIAPRHGFDRNTLKALHAEGIEWLSDGMARIPFMRGGMCWIPQQLWGPLGKTSGIWTICLHPGPQLLNNLKGIRDFVAQHHEQFTSFDRVKHEFAGTRLDAGEQLYEALAIWRLRLRHTWNRRPSPRRV